MNPIQLGKFLSELRNEKNLTQEELANKLYIDKRKVSRWECGTSIPDFDLLINISKILDVSLYELSICQRVKDEKINEKLINKFKSIKDIKKYKTKQKVKLVLKIIFVIISLFAITYTIINQGSVEIYRIISNSENYKIDGDIFDKDIIVFTHSAPYRALRHLLLGHKLKGKMLDGRIDNCQVEEFEIKK